MVKHLSITRPNQYGGYNTRTLCGRVNSAYEGEGINDTADKSEVTCKLCKKMIDANRFPYGFKQQ